MTTADPITLTTMLFDGAIKAIRKARLLHEDGNRERYLDEVERATLIVGELLSALDMEQGDIPTTLSGIYGYSMRCLVEASAGDTAKLDEVERNLGLIAAAWKQAAEAVRVAARGEGAA